MAHPEIENKVQAFVPAQQQAIDGLNEKMAAHEQAETKLQHTVSLLRATLESTADGVLVVDRSGTITEYNSRFVKMWSIPQTVLESRDDACALEFVRPQVKQPDEWLKRVQELNSLPDAESVDMIEFRDGRILERYSSGQYVGGKAVGRVWSFRDVTRVKQHEELLRENARRKDEFIAMMGHELRNPLAPIRYASDLLKLIAGTEMRVVRAREVIDRQVQHLTRIVDDMLEVSRIALGKIKLIKECVDWVGIVRAIVDDYRPEIERQGFTLDVQLPDYPLHVFGDATRLSQVVTNLLANAQKFSSPGGRISVVLGFDAQERCTTLQVSDTGIGMTPETLSRIFERFVQADIDPARTRAGLGLGLSLVKGLLELYGGSVQASSDGPGCGSTFKLRLPVTEPPSQMGLGAVNSVLLD
jgi:signal transduction histidine kinase